MKTKIFFIPIIALGAISASCQKEEMPISPTENNVHMLISADNSSSESKTSLDNFTFTWAAGDKISLFHDNSGTIKDEKFSIVKTSGTFTSSESFSGTITGWASGSKTFYGVYPYNSTVTNFDATKLEYTFTLPKIRFRHIQAAF